MSDDEFACAFGVGVGADRGKLVDGLVEGREEMG